MKINNDTKFIGIMPYGMSGCGKTWVARAAAEAVGWDRTLWVNNERIIHTFEYPEWTPETPFGVIDVSRAPLDDIRAELFEPAELAAARGEPMYDLIVFDGATEGELVNLENIQTDMKEHSRSGKVDGRQAWGTQLSALLNFTWSCTPGRRSEDETKRIGMGAYVIMTARMGDIDHPIVKDSEGNPARFYRPALRGYFGKNIDHYYNMVVFLDKSISGRRDLYLKSNSKFHIKNEFEHLSPPDKVAIAPWDSGFNIFEELLRLGGIYPE